MTIRICKILVHTPTDVQGVGWNHGKFGQGSTTVVE